jgi:hypothetical protein
VFFWLTRKNAYFAASTDDVAAGLLGPTPDSPQAASVDTATINNKNWLIFFIELSLITTIKMPPLFYKTEVGRDVKSLMERVQYDSSKPIYQNYYGPKALWR